MKLTFCGGAKSVTGANYLLEESGKGGEKSRILIDCGLFQGSRFCEEYNYESFPYDPSTIDAVLITHAHIDHIGRTPKLVKEGFRGTVYSTPPTKEFAEQLLLDSEHLLAREAQDHGHHPLYSSEDVVRTMEQWKGMKYHHTFRVKDFEIEFYDAGHILGSAMVSVRSNSGKRVVFTGDLGNVAAPLLKESETFENADYVLIESTYGDRVHEKVEQRKELLEDLIEETVGTGGVLMIPAFAMERTQELLFELNELVEHGRIPRVPIFIDSPLAIKLTAVYKKYAHDKDYFNKEAIALLRDGDAIFDFPGLHLTLTSSESRDINSVPAPKIVIAGSGMSQGGRILYHEKLYLPDPKSTLLFIGYQAVGSLGRRILEGADFVRIHGDDVPVNCRVEAIGGYSAHADSVKLLKFLSPLRRSVQKVFLVQGEEEQMTPLRTKIIDQLAVEAVIPEQGEVYEL